MSKVNEPVIRLNKEVWPDVVDYALQIIPAEGTSISVRVEEMVDLMKELQRMKF